jgi:hypothetical protein
MAGAMDDECASEEPCFDNWDAGTIWIISGNEKYNTTGVIYQSDYEKVIMEVSNEDQGRIY